MIVAIFLHGEQRGRLRFAGDAQEVEQVHMIQEIDTLSVAGHERRFELAGVVGRKHVAIVSARQRGGAVGRLGRARGSRVDERRILGDNRCDKRAVGRVHRKIFKRLDCRFLRRGGFVNYGHAEAVAIGRGTGLNGDAVVIGPLPRIFRLQLQTTERDLGGVGVVRGQPDGVALLAAVEKKMMDSVTQQAARIQAAKLAFVIGKAQDQLRAIIGAARRPADKRPN